MKIIKGNKEIELNKPELNFLISKYHRTILDLGTGDGRFTYKTAKENPNDLVIGVDPSRKQLEIYSKKTNKEKLSNALFVLGAIENPPGELGETADIVHINFPWGSLLGGIATANEKILENISFLIKNGGVLEIILGYSQESEPSEVKRLGLDKLDMESVLNDIVPAFEHTGLSQIEVITLGKEELLEIDSNWGKKLSFGKGRNIFSLKFRKN